MTATSPVQTARAGMSAAGALLLAVAGNVLVVVILAVGVALVGVAAALVFGGGVLESL